MKVCGSAKTLHMSRVQTNILFIIIGDLYIFQSISHSDIFSFNEQAMILKTIGQCYIKHIMISLIKTMISVLIVSTYIITRTTARPIVLTVILTIMSDLTFTTVVILYTCI